ncbi:G-type lectin S-receptor-like serine/threonine-protein kinase At4g27290 isoform X2 [Malania oleifera]|uniref:G-type lectin S-receptor-like serine/threonine-protein kinase At4g27290 isoform X2 n=1 Tax=Malania oleifera TaxID=397392 RepID=UPI0025AEB0BD|nr:G-type lectin S-receptor-like serine/threonine-protein kinase At4g27290 isoform X2 [Malania oleifera]
MGFLCFLFVIIELQCELLKSSSAADTIRPSQFLRDGNTLVSRGGKFELGFFSPGSTNRFYLGIWYKTIPDRTIVWVANRDKPIQDPPGALTINGNGSLLLLGRNQTVVWSSEQPATTTYPAAQLLDTGNFVVRSDEQKDAKSGSGSYLWQSFDHISDTLLPGMKVGADLRTGLVRRVSSWKSPDDPSPGQLSYEMELNAYPEPVMRKGSAKVFRNGPWNGLRFSGSAVIEPDPIIHVQVVDNSEEVYYMYKVNNDSIISMYRLNDTTSSGHRYFWVQTGKTWKIYLSTPRDYCDNYGLCGAYGVCVISESPVCQCMKGFVPKSPAKWNAMDWSDGCVRNKPLTCGEGDGFAKLEGLKLPDTERTWVSKSMGPKECKANCLANCSCVAYAQFDITGSGSGCVMWFGDLVDMRQLPVRDQPLYIRMPFAELKGRSTEEHIILLAVVVFISMDSGIIILIHYISKARRKLKESNNVENSYTKEMQEEDMELPTFDMASIANATNNFSIDMKLGEGGFGPVYKGTLPDGQGIAVKRLSLTSGQGLNEFKNEVTLMAKLQHRNLVKLLGCCDEGDERILIYEYMPNRSLDFFLFDQTKSKLLEWSTRFHIIFGIARGLLYLHQDSRLRIIHRDLKASNILLDNEMNAKISDFGLARCFGNTQITANTTRVVGTYGYMAPEYTIDGLFSIKSDVFSFGVLLLEIVTGKKNKGFYHASHNLNLIGEAWRLWKEGRPLELITNAPYEDSCHVSEILRCIHVGLLCVQHKPCDRPSMSSVVLMLSSENTLSQPKKPGFFMDRNLLEEVGTSNQNTLNSVNQISITLLQAR